MRYVTLALGLFLGACDVDTTGEPCSWEIVNNTGFTLISLEISDADLEVWGPNQLGEQSLADGATYTLTEIPSNPASYYDVRATDEDGDTYTLASTDFCLDGETLRTVLTLKNVDL